MSVMSQSGRMLFNGAAITSTSYIYNSSGNVNATAGMVHCKADSTLVQYCCATLVASTMTIRIEGKFDKMDRWAEVYSASIDAADSIDQLVNISEDFSDIRVGVRVRNAVSASNIIYVGVCNTEFK